MKKILLSICILVSTAAAFGQARFSGEYLGAISPVRWTETTGSRALVDLYFYPDGFAYASIWSFDFDLITSAEGTIDSAGRFRLYYLDGGTAVLKGTVSGGIARGTSGGKYTFAVGRRYRLPYDPGL